MPADMTSLDFIGIRTGTDKSRLRQNYLVHYERMLEKFRLRPITLIEIGIHNGASLRAWETYLPSASIVGVDIEPATRRFARDRVTIEVGSQFDQGFLDSLARKYRPDVIVDDGSHVDEHQVFSFRHLFHALNPGGLYVVEDVHAKAGPDSAADYFVALQRKVLLRGSHSGENGAPAHFHPADISHIEMIPGAVAIWKRSEDAMDADFDTLEELAAQAELPESLFYLAEYIHRHAGPLDRALAAARRAAAAAPNNPWIHFEIGKILADMGETREAVNAVEKAIALAKVPHREAIYRTYLERLLAR
ncbi:MAG TPA: class I SAM-dependent methyltransferase [Gammaproteobacteria bacterium]|nr:class I SAM-dependent methyltransferase [Gammaproteobacteria bacterium]